MGRTKPIVVAQYRASLAMLGDAIHRCPDDLWINARHAPAFWRIAYHALFFTDLYLCASAGAFSPWDTHVDGYESIDPLAPIIDGEPYAKADLLSYEAQLAQSVEERVDGLDLTGPSGMPWLPFSKLELQFYNIRHIHHHAGQLTTWLREESGREIDWVGTA